MVVMPLKRKQLIRELVQLQDRVVGTYITAAQMAHLLKKREKNTEPTYLTAQDLEGIDRYFARRSRSPVKQVQQAILRAFLGGGFRVQELCDFDPRNIDPANGRLRILGKGMKWRWAHVEDDLIAFLLEFQTQHGDASLSPFKNSYGQDYRPFFLNRRKKPFTPRHIQKFMETVSASIPGLTHPLHPHLLRHTYAVLRIFNHPTLAPEELRQDMGHEDIRTTQIYFRLAETERNTLAQRRRNAVPSDLGAGPSRPSIYCKACGKGIALDSVYCRHCGQKQ